MLRNLVEALLELASTAWGPVVLITHAFFEAFILPGAHEIFLIAVCLAKPEWSLMYGLMSTCASVCGISVGYAIGKWGGHPILQKIFPKKTLEHAEEKINQYEVWAIAIACFTPIPVKVFSVLAGAVELHFKKLVVVAFIFRGLRFMLVATLLYFFGEKARQWILDYLDVTFIVVLVVMAVGYIGLHVLERFLPHKHEKEKTQES